MHAFNLGEDDDDFRVPDGGVHRRRPAGTLHPTAAIVVEVVSPGDETWQKPPFYAKHRVDEVLIVDPEKRSVDWLGLAGEGYETVERGGLIEPGSKELAERLEWP